MDTRQKADKVFASTYARHPICLVKGGGMKVWDENGKEYLDFLAGVAVCILGHSHPAVAKAVCEQASTLVHVSNLFYTRPQTEFAQWLVDKSFADRVFLCNSGAEANEAAVKLARKYFSDKGEKGRFQVIAMQGSFHGRTLAMLSATGQEKIQKGFEPLVPGFNHVPFNDLAAVEKAIGPETAAVLVEPVLGEGGVRVPDPGYFPGLRKLCDEKGILLILDEIQTGMGRTGTLFAHEQEGIEPDIMTLAKGMANGFPVGAMLATEKVAQAFGPGSHATTFGGTPVITAAAMAVARTLDEEGILEKSRETGVYFKTELENLKKRHQEKIVSVRGKGLMLGVELKEEGAPLVAGLMEKGVLVNCTQGNILRFLPPLILENKHIDALIKALDEVLAD